MATNRSELDVVINARDQASRTIQRLQSTIIRFVGAVSASLAAINATVFPISQAIAFEKAMADVRKTTNFTKPQIEQLSASLITLSTNLNTSAEGLANIAAIAGQLGLGGQGASAVEQFTVSVAKAGIALGLTEENAARAGAQIGNIFNIPLNATDNLFSTINELSNNSVASATELIDIIKRIGTTAGSFEDAAGFAAFAKNVGVGTEVAGTSISKFFVRLSTEAAGFAKVVGVSQQEWIDLVQFDSVKAFKAATAAINQLSGATRDVTIKDLFGAGKNFSVAEKFIQEAGKEFVNLDKFLNIATKSSKEGTSINKEYAIVTQTLSSQLTKLTNQFKAIAIQVGDQVTPAILRLTKEFQAFLARTDIQEFFLEIGQSLRDTVLSIESFVKGFNALDISFTNIIQTIKIFIGLGIAQIVISIGASFIGTIKSIGKATLSFSSLAAGVASYLGITRQATAATNALNVAASRTPSQSVRSGTVAAGSGAAEGIASASDRAASASTVNRSKALQDLILVQKQSVQQSRDRIAQAIRAQRSEVRGINAAIQARGADSAAAQALNSQKNTIIATNARIIAQERQSILLNNTRIRQTLAQNTVFSRASGVVGALSGSITGAIGRVAGLTKGLGFAGGAVQLLISGFRGLFAIFGGPLGAALLAFTFFGDEIAKLFGFVDAAKERLLRIEKAEKRRVIAEGKKLVTEFNSFIEKETKDNPINLFGGVDSNTPRDVISGVDNLSKALTIAQRNIEGGEIALKNLGNVKLGIEEQIESGNGRLKELQGTISDTEKQIENFAGQSQVGEILATKKLQEAQAEYKILTKDISDAQKALISVDKRAEITSKAVEVLALDIGALARESIQGLSKESGELITTLVVPFKEAQAEVAELTKQAEKLTDQLSKSDSGADNVELQSQLDRINNRLLTGSDLVSGLEKEIQTTLGTFNKLNIDKLLQILKQPVGAVQRIGQAIEAVNKTPLELVDEAAINSSTKATINNLVAIRSLNTKLLEEFRERTKGVAEAATRAVSVFSNLSTIVKAARDRAEEFRKSINDAIASTKRQAQANRDNLAIDKQIDQTVKDITAQFEQRASQLEAAGLLSKARLAELKEELESEISIAKVKGEQNKISQESFRLGQVQSTAIEKGNALLKQEVALREEIRTKIDAGIGNAGGFANVEAQGKAISSLEALNNKVKEFRDDAAQAALDIAKLDFSIGGDDQEATGGIFGGDIISFAPSGAFARVKSDVEGVNDSIKDQGDLLDENNRKIATFVNTSKGLQIEQIESAPTGAGSTQDNLIGGVTEEGIRSITAQFQEFSDSVNKSTEQSIILNNELGKVAKTQLNIEEVSLTSAITNSTEELKKFTEISPEVAALVVSLTGSYNNLFNSVEDLNGAFNNFQEIDIGAIVSGLSNGSVELTENAGTELGTRFSDAFVNKISSDEFKQTISTALDGLQAEDLSVGIDAKKISEDLLKGVDSFNLSGGAQLDTSVDESLIRDQLDKTIFDLKVRPILQGEGTISGNPVKTGGFVKNNKISKFAGGGVAGGIVRGPGGPVGDKILAFLSNGEAVVDSFTTSFFGSSFFGSLKSVARGKAKPGALKGLIPGFQAGGIVGQASNGSTTPRSGEIIEINFKNSDTGASGSVSGDSTSVRLLVDELRKMRA